MRKPNVHTCIMFERYSKQYFKTIGTFHTTIGLKIEAKLIGKFAQIYQMRARNIDCQTMSH